MNEQICSCLSEPGQKRFARIELLNFKVMSNIQIV